ncbi:MAG: hypothetical protein CMH52_07135 [Myxococcales bacterium]|nr:hypothetical protein [Myxococcales bacterium]|tara:strand:+ start:109 stop:744 length:636 start_codon:yes stop_codon:yes gene_type:complete
MRVLILASLVFFIGCFSEDDFNPKPNDVAGSCSADNACLYQNDEIRICVENQCVAPYFEAPQYSPIIGDVSESVDYLGNGTVVLGEDIGSSNDQGRVRFRVSGDLEDNAITIKADNIIIEGHLVAMSPNMRIEIQAAGNIWIKQSARIISSDNNQQNQASFVIQADNALYIDRGVNLFETGTCNCYFDANDNRSELACVSGQCIRLEPLSP